MEHPLFTDATLRELSVASPHFRFVKPRADMPMEKSGASPEELAKHAFGVVPLWEVGTQAAQTITAAFEEAAENTMPMRREPMLLSEDHAANLKKSLDTLKDLNDHISKEDHDDPTTHHCTKHILSFASLVSNAEAIQSFAETVKAIPTASGRVSGLGTPVPGVGSRRPRRRRGHDDCHHAQHAAQGGHGQRRHNGGEHGRLRVFVITMYHRH